VSRAAQGKNRNQPASQSNYSTWRLPLSFMKGMSEKWKKKPLICVTRVSERKENETVSAGASEGGPHKKQDPDRPSLANQLLSANCETGLAGDSLAAGSAKWTKQR
ncbi:hypothetical protein DV515_00005298, partial [Chloebia gouldiae]